MKKRILIMLLSIFVAYSLKSQVQLNGKVRDIDTKKPLSCSEINLYSSSYDTTVFSHEDGTFIINIPKNEEDYNFCIDVSRSNYRYYNVCNFEINNDSVVDIQLYSFESPNYRIADIAKQDVFDLGFAFYLYSPIVDKTEEAFTSNLSFQIYNLDLHTKVARNMQIGFKLTPIELSWNKFEKPDSLYSKEQYFGASGGLSVYYRIIPTILKKTGNRGLFFDFGASYNLPYYFAYSRFTDKYNRVTTRHIKKLNDIQAMIRIGYSWWAFNANYRLSNVIKDSYLEPPKLSVGFEILFSTNN